MYVTRPLSYYYKFPNAAAEPPPDGPNSGILVIEDQEAEEQARCFWGLCKDSRLYKLPFPQNRMITVRYSTRAGQSQQPHCYDVYFIPAINEPLSSNRYHVIKAHGKYKGKTCTCSKEEDVSTFCLCTFVNDVEPRAFDHQDIYQQIKIIPRGGRFRVASVASDGIPPRFLRRKSWRAHTSEPSHYTLGEALGMNTTIRLQMPDTDFPISMKCSPSVVVGKWYCPYVFIKEGEGVKDQAKISMFYEMTLEQCWEEIYYCQNGYGKNQAVEVGVTVKRETALLNGGEVVNDDIEIVDGAIWFRPAKSMGSGLGLSLPIWERMRWEQAKGGWVAGEKVERVERVEAYEGDGGWKRFGCYVLVERFVLRRMDGSVCLTYDFRHTDKIRSKWE